MASPDDLDYLLPSNGPNPYYDTWDRHNSIAFSTATKGLHNAPGENNCFVNSAVQVFWHLDVFRRSYRRLSGHTCMGNSCIFCALKVIFTQFQFSDQSSLHPDALRKALADTFANQHRFQLGHMDDAAECFENILKRIHFHIAHHHPEDTCTAPHCLPHQKFSLSIVEKVVCPCGAGSKPFQYREMVHYISVSALVSQAQLMQESGDMLHPDRFGLLLRNANALGDIRQCPGACGKSVQIRRTLLNIPDVVSIGLGWDSDHPSMEMTTKVARSIGTAILLQDIFHSVMQDVANLPKLQLVGLVCYYCKHYSTFVFHSKLQVWIYFDDTTVKEIGPSFDHVVEKCSRGRYQPLLLLYANPNSSAVPTETAPKKRVMAPGFHLPGAEDDNSLDRTHESISSQSSVQRAVTPNPEPSSTYPHIDPSHPRARSVTPNSSYEASRKDTASPSVCGSDHSRQNSFIMAMSTTKSDPKGRHPLRMGGQAGAAGLPGPMTPVSEQDGPENTHQQGSSSSSAFRRPEQDRNNYADYTLSTSDQYRRPSMTGFTPADLPLTPNQKGHNGESPRKESFKRNSKEPVRADVIRYHMDAGKDQQSGYSPYQDLNANQQVLNNNVRSSAMFYQGPGSNHNTRQRTMSQGADEAYASDSSEYSRAPSQHVIVKPTAGGYSVDNDDKRNSYTAVQSGLATLPKKKKNQPQSEDQKSKNLPTSSSSGQNFRPVSNPQYYQDDISRHTPVVDPSGLPPLAPNRVTSPSIDQIDGGMKKSSSGSDSSEKKLKKSRKDLKKAEKKKVRSYPNVAAVETALLTRAAEADKNKDHNIMSKSMEEDASEESYINRKMVAAVLKHQGLQRQPSTHSTNSVTSNSSLESEGIMGKLLAAKSHGDASFDNVSLGSHKDSGYGSSDRNSSSSTGSGTIDPSVQYFLSKSMVVPRNFNPQMFDRQSQFVTDFTVPTPHVYPGQLVGQGEGQGSEGQGHTNVEDKTRLGYQPIGQRKIMHPIKESSQEDMLKLMSKELIEATKPPNINASPDALLSKEGRPPPIPPKNFAAFQVSKSVHQRESSIDSLDKDEVKNDYFISMCEKADDLMDRCILSETQENISDALRYCDSALGCLKEAMNQTDIEKKAAIYAQKKHKSCLLKSRSLFKRMPSLGGIDGHPGKRGSITSTDSDNSDKLVRRSLSKEQLMASNRNNASPQRQKDVCNSSISSNGSARQSPMPGSQVPEGMHVKVVGHGLRYDSTTAPSPNISSTTKDVVIVGDKYVKSHVSRTHDMTERPDSGSNHSRSGSNSSVRSSVSVPTSLSQQTVVPNLPKSQSCVGPSGAGVMPVDPYISRTRKPRRTSDPTGNSEVYQLLLHKQKHSQSSERYSSDSRDSDSSSCEGNSQRKNSKAEIRELLGNNIVQLQKQHLSTQIGSSDGGGINGARTRHSYEGSGSQGHQGTGQSSMMDCQNQGQGLTVRPANVRHSTVGYPASNQNNSRNSPIPVPMCQDKTVSKPPVTYSGQSRTHVTTPSYPSHPHPSHGKVHHDIGTTFHHERSLPSQQLISSDSNNNNNNNNVNSHQRPYPLSHQHQPPTYPSSSTSSSSLSSSSHQATRIAQVSGYNQPLPGHRVPPSNVRNNNNNNNNNINNNNNNQLSPTPSPIPRPTSSSQYNHQTSLSSSSSYPQTISSSSTSYPVTSHHQAHNSISSSSSSSSTLTNSSHPYNTNSNTSSTTTAAYNPSVQSSNPCNYSNPNTNYSRSQTVSQHDLRKPVGPPQPPPPPARTSSNPDFRPQLIQQPNIPSSSSSVRQNNQQQQQQQLHQQQQQQQLHQQQSVAHVQPNNHLQHNAPRRGQSMSNTQEWTSGGRSHHHYPPPPPQSSTPSSSTPSSSSSTVSAIKHNFNAATAGQSSQMKHAYSSTGLNTIAFMAPRPLERCTSQPDVQNLPDMDSCSTDKDGYPFPTPPLNHTASHISNNNYYNTTAMYVESGPSLRSAPTSNPSMSGTSPFFEVPERQQSVKDLLSRFDQPSVKPAIKPKPTTARSRSKSESGSKKPKSVLKSKKAKSGSGKNRKSVSFAQDFSAMASGYESAAELTSFSSSAPINDRAYFSDDEEHLGSRNPSGYPNCDNDGDVEDSSNSDEAIPPEELACQLCHKREMEPGRAYCSKCYFYMSRLTS